MKIEDILNMEIKPGIHQWDGEDNEMKCGSLEIMLPNGTSIRITSVVHPDGRPSCDISIHDLKDTKITIFGKISKSLKRLSGFIMTKIEAVA